MVWLQQLFFGGGVAHSLLVMALTIMTGLILGRVKIFGISLGATFILFAGILYGELGMKVDAGILHFFQEFGLILFVFAIGLQVGPSFFSNFMKGGRTLNLLATLNVLLAVVVTVVIYFLSGVPVQTMVGIMSGAITNTPGLGAAQQAFNDITGNSDPSIGMGYAVAYPLGVVGIILSMVLIRAIARVNISKEEHQLQAERAEEELSAIPLSLEVQNPSLFGCNVESLTELLRGRHFVVSRIWKKATDEIQIAVTSTVLEEGDRIFVITEHPNIEALVMTVGRELHIDRKRWIPEDSKYIARKVVVTRKEVNGKSLKSLNLRALYAVNVTRIYRAGVEIVASPNFILQYGDRLNVVGSDAAIENVIPIFGNSVKRLDEPNLFTIFLGIVLGIMFGSIPIMFPGIPQPVKLGLAGGPLIVAIFIARFGYKVHLVSYTTTSANLILREMGISIFLACVGINAGNGFIDTIVNQGGLAWVGYGLLITMIPLLVVGFIGRFILKLNYLQIVGMMAGATTDPPALAYANSLSDNEASAVSYATVYPLTMFLRVLAAQLMIIFLL
ncbi:putative transporter [Porphyromonas levii]|uniref:putative transporter n=1 Tax=Porphyromonas levii TaxID=28114 RepID=UPI001B8D3DE9|nr:putative transporter [Porphyromonas levii]MBR8713822.1 Aspartate/alanine antiporter [Porphyromonas levii]MBR8715662.1 Aspartate/alanine antiporter [Porphyromonas levii]MBR8728151.1 Aspartate/alanine antiporter [Porphyromonas levii]MBR8736689.1 Aspartate/alanine antiporter [Porphyromonas levii]MBR8778611.1 Aspartate/alanine antiporter [Porphyromonas levii]